MKSTGKVGGRPRKVSEQVVSVFVRRAREEIRGQRDRKWRDVRSSMDRWAPSLYQFIGPVILPANLLLKCLYCWEIVLERHQIENTTSSVKRPLTSWVSTIGRLGSTGVFPVTASELCVLTTLSPSIVASVTGTCKVLSALSA